MRSRQGTVGEVSVNPVIDDFTVVLKTHLNCSAFDIQPGRFFCSRVAPIVDELSFEIETLGGGPTKLFGYFGEGGDSGFDGFKIVVRDILADPDHIFVGPNAEFPFKKRLLQHHAVRVVKNAC